MKMEAKGPPVRPELPLCVREPRFSETRRREKENKGSGGGRRKEVGGGEGEVKEGVAIAVR